MKHRITIRLCDKSHTKLRTLLQEKNETSISELIRALLLSHM